jgi:hypothetical protein
MMILSLAHIRWRQTISKILRDDVSIRGMSSARNGKPEHHARSRHDLEFMVLATPSLFDQSIESLLYRQDTHNLADANFDFVDIVRRRMTV